MSEAMPDEREVGQEVAPVTIFVAPETQAMETAADTEVSQEAVGLSEPEVAAEGPESAAEAARDTEMPEANVVSQEEPKEPELDTTPAAEPAVEANPTEANSNLEAKETILEGKTTEANSTETESKVEKKDNYTIDDLNPEAKQIILDGCTRLQRKVEELQPDLFRSLTALSPSDQVFTANRFFMSEVGSNLTLHFTNVLRSYRSIKESYKPRVGDWLCHMCGLWNFANRLKCNFQGCRTDRKQDATVMTYDSRKEIEMCQRFLKGDCHLGDKCRYSHGAAHDAKRKGFDSLPADIQEMFKACFEKNKMVPTDIDACVYNSLNDFSPEVQKEMITSFCSNEVDLQTIRNKSGYLIGILKKYREHGKSLAGIKANPLRPRSRSPRHSSRRHSPDRRYERDYDRRERDYYSRPRSPDYHSRSSRSSYSSRYDERYERRSPHRYHSPHSYSSRSSPRRSPPRYSSYDERRHSPRYREYERGPSPRRERSRSPRRAASPRRMPSPRGRSREAPRREESAPRRNGYGSPRRETRPPSPLPAPPTFAPAKPLISVPPAIDVKWYWTDLAQGTKNGPSTVFELKSVWCNFCFSCWWVVKMY